MVFLTAGLCFNMSALAVELARGDGFTIDSSDVEAQKAFFSEKGFESTDTEHLNSVLKIRLFVLEARDSGLISSLPEAANKDEMVKEYYRLSQVYYLHLMETYPVSEDAILSYYLSYPDKFLLNKEGAIESIKKQDIRPLDDNIKDWIRNQITQSKQAVIMER